LRKRGRKWVFWTPFLEQILAKKKKKTKQNSNLFKQGVEKTPAFRDLWVKGKRECQFRGKEKMFVKKGLEGKTRVVPPECGVAPALKT